MLKRENARRGVAGRLLWRGHAEIKFISEILNFLGSVGALSYRYVKFYFINRAGARALGRQEGKDGAGRKETRDKAALARHVPRKCDIFHWKYHAPFTAGPVIIPRKRIAEIWKFKYDRAVPLCK